MITLSAVAAAAWLAPTSASAAGDPEEVFCWANTEPGLTVVLSHPFHYSRSEEPGYSDVHLNNEWHRYLTREGYRVRGYGCIGAADREGINYKYHRELRSRRSSGWSVVGAYFSA